jgi:hypothetical protein
VDFFGWARIDNKSGKANEYKALWAKCNVWFLAFPSLKWYVEDLFMSRNSLNSLTQDFHLAIEDHFSF